MAEYGEFLPSRFRMPEERLEIPVNSTLTVVAAVAGVAVGLLVAYLLWTWSQPRPPPVAPTQGFTIIRDEQGRIIEVQGVR